MPSRRRASSGGASRISDEQMSDLVAKLQALLPDRRPAPEATTGRVPSARVLQETRSYIRSLHREADDLSDRLSQLLATAEVSAAQAAVIRSLLS